MVNLCGTGSLDFLQSERTVLRSLFAGELGRSDEGEDVSGLSLRVEV